MADPAIHASAACFVLISFLLSSDSATSIQCRSTAMQSRQLSAEWPFQMALMDDKTTLLWHPEPSSPMLCWSPEMANHCHASLLPDDPPCQYFLNTGDLTTSSEKYSSPKTEEEVADLLPNAKWTLLHLLHFWQLCSPLCLSLLHLGWMLRDWNHVSAVSHAFWWLRHLREPGRREAEPTANLLFFSCHTRRVGMSPAGAQHGREHPCLGQMDPPLAMQTAGVTQREPRLTSDFWALQVCQERDWTALTFC